MSEQAAGYFTPARNVDHASDYNALSFAVGQIISGRHHVGVVQVKACTNAGNLAAVGFVDVVPMVHQLDAGGGIMPHGTIYHLPYARIQGGGNAVIIDPEEGDIGLALFADRDISVVKATRKAAAPGSFRQNDWADGVYLGGILNSAPSQFVRFSTDGIFVESPTLISITAPAISSAGDWSHDGGLTTTGDVVAAGVSVDFHEHEGVTAGGEISGIPVGGGGGGGGGGSGSDVGSAAGDYWLGLA